MGEKSKTRKAGEISRSSGAGEAEKTGKISEAGKTGERAKRRRRAQTAFLAAALGFATFAAFAQTEETSRAWKGRSGKVVVTGTLDVKRTLKESPDAASTPEDVYFRGENGKAYKFGYAKLCDADKARVDAALGLTAEPVADAALGSTAEPVADAALGSTAESVADAAPSGSRTLGGGEEASTAAASGKRRLVATPKDGKLASPTGFKAFLVGADDYRDATDLAFVKNDVEALAARLVELGFEEKNVAVLKTGGDFGDFPTKDNVEERFAAFVESLRPGDFAVVYLSGHGIQPADSKESFFAPIDVKARDPFGTAVSIDKMLAALESSDANFRWMIVDACRDDPTNAKAIFKTRSAAGAKGLVEIASAPKSTSLLQSCQPGKFSYECGDGVDHGVFTLSLLEALDKNNPRADVDKDGALAFSEVFKYVTERTNELAQEHCGATQTPNWSGQITDFAILSGLLRDGLTQARWLEADALYQEACALRRQKKWREAAEKLSQARKINAVNEDYVAAEAEIAEILRLQTEAQAAATAQAEAERKAKEEAEARAAAERRAQNAGSTSERPLAPRWNGREYVAVDGGNSSSGSALDTTHRYAQNSSSLSGRTSSGTSSLASASGGWTGTYAAGTQKSLNIKGATYNFRYCPAGTFTMGSPESEPDRLSWEKQHEVKLTQGFWMLETEVTQALWESVTGKNPITTSYLKGPNKPVGNVSWEDCQEFIAKLNSLGIAPAGLKFRLPTEAEWEYACRAGASGPYAGSSLDSMGWYKDNSGYNNHEVGKKAPNAWGLYDMHGNVWEWCSDWFASATYDAASQTDPTGPASGSDRVLRGGSCYSSAKYCRSADRLNDDPTDRDNDRGFRLVLGR